MGKGCLGLPWGPPAVLLMHLYKHPKDGLKVILKIKKSVSSTSWVQTSFKDIRVWFYTPIQQFFMVSQRSSCCWLSEQRDRTIFFFFCFIQSEKQQNPLWQTHSWADSLWNLPSKDQDQGVCFCRPLPSKAVLNPTWRKSRSKGGTMGASGGTPDSGTDPPSPMQTVCWEAHAP